MATQHANSQEEEGNNLGHHKAELVDIHARVDSPSNYVCMFGPNRAVDYSTYQFDFFINIRVVVKRSLRPWKDQGVQKLDEDELWKIQWEECQGDTVKYWREEHSK